MKKFFVFAAAAAFALVACNKDNPTVDGSGTGSGNNKPLAGLVLNELDGQNKFIEIYNPNDAEAFHCHILQSILHYSHNYAV